MKIWALVVGCMLTVNSFGQLLEGAQQVNLFVHAHEGLALRAAPDYHAKELEQIEYGTELVIISYTDTLVTINGFKGKWAEVSIDKQRGYVFDAYLSDWPIILTEDYHPHLCDYIYAMGDLVEGDKSCTINDNSKNVHSIFEQGDYRFTGDECDAEEVLNLKDISVQEAYIVFSGFIPTYGGISFAKIYFEWDKGDGVYVHNFTDTEGEFSHWYHVTYTKNKQDELDYMEVYFDWEGGGGSLKILENEKIEGVTVQMYYGCH